MSLSAGNPSPIIDFTVGGEHPNTNLARAMVRRLSKWRLPISEWPNPTLFLPVGQAGLASFVPRMDLTAAADYEAYYLAPDSVEVRPFELVDGPARNGCCGFWEIDQALMPGLYGLQLPLFLRGRGMTFIRLCFGDCQPLYLEIKGVEYDPYDPMALGLETWIRSNCHDHLTTGLRKSMPSVLRPLLVDWLASG